MIEGLAARGVDVAARPGRGFGRPRACMIRDGRFDGGYDPRREGVSWSPSRRLASVSRPDRFGNAGKAVALQHQPFQPAHDPPREPGPSIDQGGVELDQARPGADPVIGVRAAGDAAGPDQRQRAAGRPAEIAQPLQRQLLQRRAGKAARLAAHGATAAAGRRDRGVGDDQRVEPLVERDPRRCRRYRAGSRSGATFRNTGGRRVAARRQHRGEQLVSAPSSCKRAQARRVGRGDVDRQIIGERRHPPDARRIIGDRGRRAVLVGADIDADDAAPRRRAVSRFAPPRLPAVVEAHAVDHRPVLGQPEQPRLRIARLRRGRERADLDEAEAAARASARAPRHPCRSRRPGRPDWESRARRPRRRASGSARGGPPAGSSLQRPHRQPDAPARHRA